MIKGSEEKMQMKDLREKEFRQKRILQSIWEKFSIRLVKIYG